MLKLGRSLGYCPGEQDAVGGRTMALTKKSGYISLEMQHLVYLT